MPSLDEILDEEGAALDASLNDERLQMVQERSRRGGDQARLPYIKEEADRLTAGPSVVERLQSGAMGLASTLAPAAEKFRGAAHAFGGGSGLGKAAAAYGLASPMAPAMLAVAPLLPGYAQGRDVQRSATEDAAEQAPGAFGVGALAGDAVNAVGAAQAGLGLVRAAPQIGRAIAGKGRALGLRLKGAGEAAVSDAVEGGQPPTIAGNALRTVRAALGAGGEVKPGMIVGEELATVPRGPVELGAAAPSAQLSLARPPKPPTDTGNAPVRILGAVDDATGMPPAAGTKTQVTPPPLMGTSTVQTPAPMPAPMPGPSMADSNPTIAKMLRVGNTPEQIARATGRPLPLIEKVSADVGGGAVATPQATAPAPLPVPPAQRQTAPDVDLVDRMIQQGAQSRDQARSMARAVEMKQAAQSGAGRPGGGPEGDGPTFGKMASEISAMPTKQRNEALAAIAKRYGPTGKDVVRKVMQAMGMKPKDIDKRLPFILPIESPGGRGIMRFDSEGMPIDEGIQASIAQSRATAKPDFEVSPAPSGEGYEVFNKSGELVDQWDTLEEAAAAVKQLNDGLARLRPISSR